MYADKETLAHHNGQPLLNPEGMESIGALLDAHTGMDESQTLHAEEIRDLQGQIDELVAQKKCPNRRQRRTCTGATQSTRYS
jgi:hypothetical protein